MIYDSEMSIQWTIANRYFNPRTHTCVPNVSWGLFHYEHDLVVLTKSGYCWEIEIKISKGDLKADLKKSHGHRNKYMKRLYYAMPEEMGTEEIMGLVPERAGILLVNTFTGWVTEKRPAKDNPEAVALSEDQKYKLMRLFSFRFWRTQQRVYELYSRISALEASLTMLRETEEIEDA